jgi:organic hydroperoxide reductase OsmC/OhrA
MSNSKTRAKKFIYKNRIKWTENRKGLLSSSGKPDLAIATPPEFKGHPNIWTPEDLFVAAVNSCLMTTFLYYAGIHYLDFDSYAGDAEGTLESSELKLIFTEVKVFARIKVKSKQDIEKAMKCINLSEKNCLISNSIKSNVQVIPEIITDSQENN